MKVISPKSHSNSVCKSGYVMGLPLNAEDNQIIKDELKHMECDMAWISATKNAGANQSWKNTAGTQIDYFNWTPADDGETNLAQYAALDTNGKWHKKYSLDNLNCLICVYNEEGTNKNVNVHNWNNLHFDSFMQITRQLKNNSGDN
jgi:hypothetical protein